MRNFWTLFVLGLFSSAVLTVVFAENKDPRVKQINDNSISGLKTDVPLSKDMEAALTTRETEVAERERRVKEAEERLTVEESRVKDRVDELQSLLDMLEKKRAENRKVNDETLKRLVKTFESMAPKKAAGVVSVMNDDLAVELMMAMKEKKVAALLEVMDPNRAMTLSSLVAKRRPAGKAALGEQAPPSASPR
ncbi:MAG: hypothetical protein JST16_02320 [Bdellovibrionales bacterium]|nr:hypothetical protein [Bdellovibrionales bacterium]